MRLRGLHSYGTSVLLVQGRLSVCQVIKKWSGYTGAQDCEWGTFMEICQVTFGTKGVETIHGIGTLNSYEQGRLKEVRFLLRPRQRAFL